ncbi:phosphoribosylformylglycinamidine synthase subunit PurQ [Marinicauda algicola]|uniref:Phosphoribosylformylglycinamidine synthase subunit PurQ n=1 Tax=Marinicauda algicola TaxID=2029849 RepID=A0A4S2H0I2_9PROT|nr:phosphoribosylformylglycinamidine synthase subunit PurQ [Marinicauda algicola]TGY88592.1 phosphoribosylformylglycinamidine synthase subunit PurQ [Marinicauda algicola]
MKTAVIVFPGSNCDRDAADALQRVTGIPAEMVWHEDTTLPDGLDLVVVPGGFSYGDYLRSGAIAARSPIMRDVVKKAGDGTPVLGVCNGFQILIETGLLPGALMRNAGLRFVCERTPLSIETKNSMFTRAYGDTKEVVFPIAHHDGNYFADEDTLKELEDEGRVVFRYLNNPNGSIHDIAGIANKAGNVLGMMPHPERAVDETHGGTDGLGVFESLLGGQK